MNLIGSRPDGWWRDRPAAWRRLRVQLEDFAQRRGDEVTLVLDGRRPGDWEEDGEVETVFASGGRGAADDAIVARVEADPDPGGIRVVTSDRELERRVRELGAETASVSSFRDELEESAG
jgi:uncharacterized protein YaiI (UPF0178 family)